MRFGSGSPAGGYVPRVHGGLVPRRQPPAEGFPPVTGGPVPPRKPRPKPRHKGHRPKPHKKHKPPGKPPAPQPQPQTTTEKLKETSTQSGQQAMAATPTQMPSSANPDFSQAVYSTGPGEVVVYGYDRTGQGAEQYALQQSAYTAPVPQAAGSGQVLTPAAAGGQ